MSYEEELLERARQQGIIDRGSRPAPTPPPPKLVGTLPESPSAYNSPQNQQTAQDLISGDFKKTDSYTGAQEGERGFVERSVNFGASLMASVFDFSDSVEDVQKKGVARSFAGNPIENTFDFAIAWPLMKLYERVNQTGSYLGALAPGGIDPISFTDAGTISPGQVASLNVNVARDNIRNRRGDFAADMVNLFLTGLSPGGQVPLLTSDFDMLFGDGDGLYLPKDFINDPERFLNEAEKNKVFGEGQAQFASGAYDFMWALVVDPLIFVPVGKVTKFARLRFIDQDTRKVGTGLADDPTEEIVKEVTDSAKDQGDRVARETAALEAREGRPATYEEVMEIAGPQVSVDGKGGLLPASLLALAGSKLAPAMQQFNRMVYGNSNEYARSLEMGSNEEALWGFLRAIVSDKTNSVFSNYTPAQRYQAALLLWRAQWVGDKDAAKAFTDAFPGLASIAITNASFVRSRRFLPDNAPIFNAVDEQFNVFAKDGEEAIAALQRFPDSGSPGYQVALEDLRDIIEANMQITQNGDLVYNAAKLAAANRLLKQMDQPGAVKTIIDNQAERTRQSPEYKALDQDVAEQAKAAEEMITKGQLQAIQFAAKSVGEMRIYENLTEVNTRLLGGGSTEFKMGRNNKLGRWNQQRRYINESKTASIQPLVGLGPIDLLKTIRYPAAASTIVPFYTMNGTQNFIRLWRLPGRERPAGNVDLEGIGAVGNLREVQAMIFSTRAFTGAARVDPSTGISYGGRERGEALLNQFIEQTGRANNNPAEASRILKELESKLAKEVFRYAELGAAKASKSGKVYDRILKDIFKKGNQDPQAIKIREALANQGIQAWAEKSPTSVVVDDKTLDLILDYAQDVFNRGRDKTMADAAQNRLMFIDNNGQLNHIPLGENQTANTMQLMNLRYFEQHLGQTNMARKSFGAIDSFLNAFNIAWRPAVLFRLGYPIRNVGEGQIRAIAYQQSLRPVVEMFQAAGQSVGDLALGRAGSRSGKKQIKRAEKKIKKIIASYEKQLEKNPDYGKEARGWISRDARLNKEIQRQKDMQMNRINNSSNALDAAIDDFVSFLDENGLDPESTRVLLTQLREQLQNVDMSLATVFPDFIGGPPVPFRYFNYAPTRGNGLTPQMEEAAEAFENIDGGAGFADRIKGVIEESINDGDVAEEFFDLFDGDPPAGLDLEATQRYLARNVYERTQEGLVRQGFPEMVVVTRTGSPGSNRGVVSVALGPDPVPGLTGDNVMYMIPRDRILADIPYLRGQKNPAIFRPDNPQGALIRDEREALVLMDELIPMDGYDPKRITTLPNGSIALDGIPLSPDTARRTGLARMSAQEAEAKGVLREWREQAIKNDDIYDALTAPDPNAPRVKQGDWILETIEEAGMDITPDEVRPSKILPSKGNKPISDLDIKFIKHGVVSREWLNQLANENGVEQMMAWLYTGLLDNGAAQGGGNVPIPTPARRLETRQPDGTMKPDESVNGMPEEWFATGTESIKVGRGKTQEMIVVPWAKAMIERQKNRVAKPGELSNDELARVEFAIRNGDLDDRIEEILGGQPSAPEIIPEVNVAPDAELSAKVGVLGNIEQSRLGQETVAEGIQSEIRDSYLPVGFTDPANALRRIDGTPIPLETDLPPVPGGGKYPDAVTRERKIKFATTKLQMKWNGMDPDLQLVAEFNRRLANIRSAQRELRDSSQRWAQMQDPAVAIEIVAAQRQLKAAERRREMMQDMGVAAVPTLLARGEGADPFNPNSVLAAPASSAASAATTTRSRLTADSNFSQQGWRELENQRYTVINIEDLRKQGYPPELMEEYWAGNAEQLRLLSTNYFGRAVMEAETKVVNEQLVFTEEALADLLKLFETPKGRDNWEVIAWTKPPDGVDINYPGGIRRPFQQRGMKPSADEDEWSPVRGSLEDLNNQEQYLNFLLHHLQVLTPGNGFREAIRAGKVPGLLGDKANRNLIESVKEYNGQDLSKLQTIIGDRLLAGGEKGFFKAIADKYKAGVNVGFNWIGTMPEDALLRMPFYRAEYERVYGRTIALMEQTMGSRSMLTGEEIGRAAFAAHKEAIRATRKYLYTIQRRTWLGDSFEGTIPFISAGQNAAQAVGRMVMNDPTVATVGAYYWARGWEEGGVVNDQGEIELPWLEPLLPSWLKDAGINSISLNVGSLNVMFPDSGFGPFFRPGPVVGIPASLMMKHGLLLSPATPGLATRMLGQDKADPAWAAVNKWLFADAGPMPDVVKATLPSWLQKYYDWFQGDGESAAYTAMVSAIARSEMLRVSAGEYEGEDPTMQEIWDDARVKANMMYLVIKPLTNLLSPTSIQMNSDLRPLVEEYRHYQEVYGFDADRKFIEQYGEIMLMLADSNRSQNVAGVDIEAASVRRAKKYSGLTKEIANAGILNANPRLLGVILNDPTPDKDYDFNIGALRWLQTKTIPGTSKSYRELLSSQEAMTESSTSAGWSYWLMFVDDLNVVAQQRGLADYKRAPDLEELAEQMKAKMAANPLYAGWWESYGLQERETKSTIKLMRIMADPDSAAAMEFVEDPMNAQLVNGMIEYLSLRDRAQATILQVEKGITAGDNEMIQKAWLDGVSQIVNRNPVFQEFYERYLFADREAAMKDQVPYEGGLLGSDRQLPDVGELRVNPETGEREWVE